MVLDVKTLEKEAKKDLQAVQNLKELDDVFRKYLGRKSELAQILESLSKLKKAERVKMGKTANAFKDTLNQLFDERRKALQTANYKLQTRAEDWLDITLPAKKVSTGHLHPLTLVQRQAEQIFHSMGFGVAQGPEVENDWYNFGALNMPQDHPAREMWDTFWLKPENPKSKIQNPRQHLLLRTHTSPVQVRYMESHNPPVRIIAPGTVYRYEATDARHEFQLIQLEGLLVDKQISVANFKAVIQEFYRRFFQKDVAIRLRPSYFPFTEPSFEVDMSCLMCGGKGCASCGHAGWMEMMGAGMVHPNVLKAVTYDPREWRGFAFGMGLDRLAMMKYKIPDIRMFRLGDLRFLQQF